MEGLKAIPYISLVLAISGIILGAAVVSLAQFDSTISTCFNSSYAKGGSACVCTNATPAANGYPSVGPSSSNMSNEGYAVCQSIQGESTIAEQLPTIAIIGVMVIIISIIAGVFVYLRYFS